MKLRFNNINRISILIGFIIIGYLSIDIIEYKKLNLYNSDFLSYYAYLPASFVYHDLSLDFAKDNYQSLQGKKFILSVGPKGHYVIRTTYGISLLILPFFLLAHFLSFLFAAPMDGFSMMYTLAIICSSLVYFAIGIIILAHLLKHFFSERAVLLSLAIIGLGTNLLFYSTYESTMSHAPGFVLISLFLWLSIQWHEKPGFWISVYIGLVAGLIVLIRPSNILVGLFFIFYKVFNGKDFKNKFIFLFKNWYFLILIAGFALVMWIPQMIYWKAMTGMVFYDTYSDTRFFFNNPQIIPQLFSYRKGWLLYTPLMSLSFFGLIFLFRKYKSLFLPVSLFLLLNIYVLSSWCFWWFGGSFGSRGYIDGYAILALPIAAVAEFVLSWRKIYKATAVFIIGLFMLLNILQTIQCSHGYIHWIGMTKEAYRIQFLQFKISNGYIESLLYPNYDNAYIGVYDPKEDYTGLEFYEMHSKKNIQEEIEKMKSSKKRLSFITEKAKKRNISVDEMLRLDAQWILRQRINNQKKEKNQSGK